MSPDSNSSSPQAVLDAYLDDAMGVRFDALARYAEPLFDLYGVELRRSLIERSDACPTPELRTLLTALDTARLFWAYFSLDDAAQQKYRSALRECLIGPNPDAEAKASFQNLTEVMHERWNDLSEGLRAHASNAASTSLPPIAELLETYASPTDTHAADASAYGPNGLEQPEALALFSQPLFDDPAVQADPDALELRMALATAYWDLAHAAPADREVQLEALLDRFGDDPVERKRLRHQAQEMLERFETLFPEQAS